MIGLGLLELLIILVLLAGGAGVVLLVVFLATRSGSGPKASSHPNLVPCHDCGQLISLRAATCPHCGGAVTAK